MSEALGFTVVDSEGRMVLRVAWRHRDAPTQMEQRARELVQTPGLSLGLRPIRIGPHRGMMLTGAPGIDPSTYVYLVAYDRLYELVCPEREGGIEACMALFHSLSFHPTARSPEALGLKKAEDALYEEPPLLETPEPKGSLDTDMGTFQVDAEPLAAPGCADWPTSKFLQTPWASTANGDSGWP